MGGIVEAEERGFGFGGFTSTGVILVLFILLVIIACSVCGFGR